MNDYPEHRKLSKIQKDSQVCGEFLDWLTNEKEVMLALWKHDNGPLYGDWLTDSHYTVTGLLNEYFDIDGEALEAEKQDMLRATREADQPNGEWKQSL